MKDTGYRILREAPLIKKKAAVESECKCPVCGKKDGIRVTEYATGSNAMQNKYECPQCGTIWVGNYYDAGWNARKDVPEVEKSKNNAYLLGFIIYAIMNIVLAEGSIFVAIPVILFNIVLVVAFMIAGACEYDKHRQKIYLLCSMGFFATIVSIIIVDVFIL